MKCQTVLLGGSAILFGVLSVSEPSYAQPSFDCDRAATEIELAICNDSELANKDAQLSELYSEFVRGVPDSSRAEARQIQRLWLRNRTVRCADRARYYLDGMAIDRMPDSREPPNLSKEALAALPFELSALPATSLSECLSNYYDFGIGSLERGALTADVYMVEGVREYEVGVSDIDSLIIAPGDQEIQSPTPDAAREEVFLNIQGENVYLTEIAVDSRYSAGGILSLRLIMTKGGGVATAIQSFGYNRSGRCGATDNLSLRFFNIADDSIVYYTGADQGRVDLLYATYTCNPSTERITGWDAGTDELFYISSQQYSDIHQVFLPDVSAHVVDLVNYSITQEPYVDTNPDEYRGLTYEGLWRGFDANHNLADINSDRQCEVTRNLLSRYMALKVSAAGANISQAQGFFILEEVWELGRFDDAVQMFAPAARVFLDYLENARSVDDWQEKLEQVSEQFPRRNHHGSPMGSYPERGATTRAGFPTDGGCFAQYRSPAAAMNLEDWMYLFWYRRASDGNLERVEALLQKAVDIDEAIEVSE